MIFIVCWCALPYLLSGFVFMHTHTLYRMAKAISSKTLNRNSLSYVDDVSADMYAWFLLLNIHLNVDYISKEGESEQNCGFQTTIIIIEKTKWFLRMRKFFAIKCCLIKSNGMWLKRDSKGIFEMKMMKIKFTINI